MAWQPRNRTFPRESRLILWIGFAIDGQGIFGKWSLHEAFEFKYQHLTEIFHAIFGAAIGVLDRILERIVLPRFRGECGVCLRARPGHTNV